MWSKLGTVAAAEPHIQIEPQGRPDIHRRRHIDGSAAKPGIDRQRHIVGSRKAGLAQSEAYRRAYEAAGPRIYR